MENITRSKGNRAEKVRVHRKSTRVDMTPMVDLAFLLLAFFMLTTTFNRTTVLGLTMPEKISDTTQVPEKNADDILNIVLAKEDAIFWWTGLEPPVRRTDYSPDGIREILLRHRSNPGLMVLIKPDGESRYENMVDLLDELEITEIPRYMIVDLELKDRELVETSFGKL